MLKSRMTIVIAASVCLVGLAMPGVSAKAANPAAGTCAFNGTASFTPNDQLVPLSSVGVAIFGNGTCVGGGIPLEEGVSLTFQGIVPLASCEAGEGVLGGVVDFSSGIPPEYSGPGTYVGGPAGATLTIAGPFSGVATLGWSNSGALAACAGGGAASTTLTGTFTFVQS